MLRCWDGLWRFMLSKKSENLVINVSQYQSPLYPRPKTKMTSWKITSFDRRYIDSKWLPFGCAGHLAGPIGCQAILAAWAIHRRSRFFWTSLGILRVSMQNVTKNHTKVSHSSVISKNVTSSFQWEPIRTGLLPASICFSKQMMLPEPQLLRPGLNF